MSRHITSQAKKHIEYTDEYGRDLHACPQCGKLYECDAILPLDAPIKEAKHYINCAEHGQQIGVGDYYLEPK